MVPPQGNLVIVNETTGWAKVTVNGTAVGLMAPQSRVTLHEIQSGGYDVGLTLTSGFTWSERLQTCGLCKAADWEPGK